MSIISKAKEQAILKVRAFEKNARIRNRSHMLRRGIHAQLNALPQPELSVSEKQEIHDFWSRFGIDIKDYSWFRWYYGITGIKDPRYIPQDLYFNYILPHYNRQEFIPAYKDKNQFDLRLPSQHFPKALLKRMNNGFYDPAGNFMTNDIDDKTLASMLLDQKQIIVKNAIDSGCGLSVRKYNLQTLGDAQAVLREWTVPDYVIQEVIQQHPFFAQFNESSVNIIRINSWFRDGEVILSSPVLRFGMPGKFTDVCFIDGEEIINLVGITMDGQIRDEIVRLSGKKQPLSAFQSDLMRQVPEWDALTAMVRENAKRLCHFHLIGWDVTVSADGRPLIIEYNIFQPGTIPSQMVNGPMWGAHTEDLLAFLKNRQA